eukprot:7072088-Pyramimonas_sp.AAC.1
MAIQIKGEGNEADQDLLAISTMNGWGWRRKLRDLANPSDPRSQQMKKCPCVQMTPVMYDRSGDEYWKGM